MSPDERKSAGRRDQRAEGRGQRGARRAPRDAEGPRSTRGLRRETLDVTLPVRAAGVETGRIHPISQVIDEVTAIFADMGFSIAEGPDIESDDYNFTKLNFPPGHPAREMHDTFFFAPDATGDAQAAAHPYEPGAGAHDARAKAADPRRFAQAAPTAPISTRRTRRCSIRSRASSSTRARHSAT